MRYGYLFEKDEKKSRMKQDFSKVSDAVGADAVAFLKAAGGFVEKWISPQQNETAREILRERDELCFREIKDDASLPKKRREEILRDLRKAAFSLLAISLVIFSSVNARCGPSLGGLCVGEIRRGSEALVGRGSIRQVVP